MPDLRALARGAIIALTAAVLSSCTVVVDDGPVGPIDPGPRFCPKIYDPVCAVGGGERSTFPNACEADAAGYRVVRGGACRRDRPEASLRPDFCTREFRPVCARGSGGLRTYGNECEAERAGARVVDEGEC